ncbi:MAG: hypothetical protein M1831_001202 [Alyxoria varia]|nr:MAG: hypothetical protein M1831_001202 [Alyxoria varia]
MAQVNDPSRGVAQSLLWHVHLLSTIQFSHQPHPLNQDQILNHLLHAPKIVREQYPVAWQFLKPPKDGTVMLRWQPNSQLSTNYATDGFHWANPESIIQREYRGFKLEIFLREAGYQPGESFASHRRIRYRLIAVPNQEPYDPNLELVHYLQTSPNARVPVGQFPPPSPRDRHLWSQRQYLESSGALVRKEFMLNDSNNWPAINLPRPPPTQQMAPTNNPYQQQQPQGPGGAAAFQQPPRAPGGGPPGFYNQPENARAGAAPQPAKRGRPQRNSRGQAQPRAPNPQTYEESVLADEENPQDSLDFLSPQRISLTRFTQHTDWMDEVTSSPNPVNRILPVQLWFGLGGELSELTNGLFDQPSVEQVTEGAQGHDEPMDIEPDKIEELERRITKFQDEGRKEIEAMKQHHSRTLKELSDRKSLSQLEIRLNLKGFDDEANTPTDSVEDIVRQAEKMTGATLNVKEEVSRIQAGGLLQGGEEQMGGNGNLPGSQGDEFNDFANLDFFQSEPYDSTMEFST